MLEQRSDAWFAERLGRVTASRIADVMAKTKTGPSASRSNYATQLLMERLTGRAAPSFSNAAMDWGTETEPQARAMYAFVEGVDVMETGFHRHPLIEMSGASPDGICGETGLVEIKCPNSATHIATLMGKNIDRKYLYQMQWQLACTDRVWCDFVSFDPRMTPAKQYFCQRVERDDKLITEIEAEVRTFLAEIDDTLAQLEAEYPEQKAA